MLKAYVNSYRCQKLSALSYCTKSLCVCRSDNTYGSDWSQLGEDGNPVERKKGAAGGDLYPLLPRAACDFDGDDQMDCGTGIEMGSPPSYAYTSVPKVCSMRNAVYDLGEDLLADPPREVNCVQDRQLGKGNQALIDLDGGEGYARDGSFTLSLWFTKGWCNATMDARTEGVLFHHKQANESLSPASIRVEMGCPGQNSRGSQVRRPPARFACGALFKIYRVA